jgi:protein O-GlcNAc transferase
VEGSVLWLLADNEPAMRNLRREAAARGIDPDRLVFAPRMALPQHLARHRVADLSLDTLPCCAHTTASDSLWAGLPIITWVGRAFAGRVAASLLSAVGMPDLITHTAEEYEALALRLARDPAALGAIRDRLAANLAGAPLFDTARFRRHIEAAYATMWQRHEQGLPPAAFDVPALAPG